MKKLKNGNNKGNFMSIIHWLKEDKEVREGFEELDLIHQEERKKYNWIDQSEKTSPTEIIIKPEAIDKSKIVEGEGSKQYRPKTLEDYVGQEEAKEKIREELQGCKDFNEPFSHTFLSAPPGHGKTLMANIISDILGKKIVECVGGELKSEKQFMDKVNECEGGVIFIDEANRLSKKVGFFMLPIIEKFEYDKKPLIPFTVILATTHMGDISKDLDALIDRCNLKLELNHYKEPEIVEILKGYQKNQYSKCPVPDNVYDVISKNCRYTPRLARTMLRNYIFNNDIEKVLQNSKIVKDGLTKNDVKVLKNLEKFEKGVGKANLASILKVKPSTYEHEIEPFLLFKEFIMVSNKRKITDKGKQFLKEIK